MLFFLQESTKLLKLHNKLLNILTSFIQNFGEIGDSETIKLL